MTDHFGIGVALKGSANLYFMTARKSGRTVSMVESVKDGDLLIFSNTVEARRVEALCLERGVKVRVTVVDPGNPGSLFNRPGVPVTGRALFDHGWVEDFYKIVLDRAAEDIQKLQNNLSGEGEPHRETRRRAAEVQKWGRFL